MAPLASVAILATRWHQLGHKVAPLAFVQNLVIRWRHLHWFQSWQPGGKTCSCYKFGYQVVSLGLSHCLGMPCPLMALSVDIDLVSSSARVTPVKSATRYSLFVLDTRTHRSSHVYLGPIKTKKDIYVIWC